MKHGLSFIFWKGVLALLLFLVWPAFSATLPEADSVRRWPRSCGWRVRVWSSPAPASRPLRCWCSTARASPRPCIWSCWATWRATTSTKASLAIAKLLEVRQLAWADSARSGNAAIWLSYCYQEIKQTHTGLAYGREAVRRLPHHTANHATELAQAYRILSSCARLLPDY